MIRFLVACLLSLALFWGVLMTVAFFTLARVDHERMHQPAKQRTVP
jgi:hypothetical protein